MLSFIFAPVKAAEVDENTLLVELLHKLDSVSHFKSMKEQSIAVKKINPVFEGKASVEKYDAYMDIARSYWKYNGDSCIVYVDKSISTAHEIGASVRKYKALIYKSNSFSLLGYFTEMQNTECRELPDLSA